MKDFELLMERWRRCISEDREDEMNEIAPALATAARVATKAGAVADKVGKVAGAVKTGSDIVKKITGDDDDDEKNEDLEEHDADQDSQYPSRIKKRRNRAISFNASKHGDTFVPGHDEMMQLARGISESFNEDIVNTDNLEADISTLQSVVARELQKAFASIQKQGGGCDFNDLIRATRMWAMAQKAKAPD